MFDVTEFRNKYVELYGAEPCSSGTLVEIETLLCLKLPEDFKNIAEFYSGGLLGGISHHEIASSSDATNIVEETLRIRKATGLRKNLVILAEPPGSIIAFDVCDKPAIIWCDAVEVENLNSMEFINAPDTWDSYSEFFLIY
jgi:hypothetical protein